jgi:hypothetical protein
MEVVDDVPDIETVSIMCTFAFFGTYVSIKKVKYCIMILLLGYN